MTTPTVPAAIADDHRFILAHLARPGTWWTAADRVAIAAESRAALDCRLCAARREALSPRHVAGDHDAVSDLPSAVVDIAHQIRADPRRLSRQWYDEVVATHLSDAEYVELVGIVAVVSGIDAFRRAMGEPAYLLPSPVAGEPTRVRPVGVSNQGAWVPMLAPADATGPELDLYPPSPVVPNIMRALSLVPSEARVLIRLTGSHYLTAQQLPDPTVRRDLDRMQMELVAARVSALNQCFY